MTPGLNGVAVFAPDTTMIGHIALPERCANLCFGGRKRNRLFMAASQSLYSVYVNTQGAWVVEQALDLARLAISSQPAV